MDLYDYAFYGDTRRVQVLLRKGVRPDSWENENGATPLYVAAQYGHRETVLALIAAGAKIDRADDDGATPLYIAAQNGHTEIASTLITAGANINQAMNDGATPLFVAAEKGQTATVSALIAAGANINQAMNNGFTPLYIAAQNGHTEIASTLINAGANVNQAMNDGATALFIAAEKGQTATVSALITAGANINQADKIGATPLYIAAQNGQTATVSALIAAGANINQAMNDESTPLMVAACNGHTIIVSTLIAAGANINQVMNDGSTALFIAAEYGHSEIVSALITSGANINQALNDGTTPLCIAAKKGHAAIVFILLEAKANINIQTKDGLTPLMIAQKNGRDEVIHMLEEYTTRTIEREAKVKTLLIDAVKSGNTSQCKLLLDEIKNPNVSIEGNSLLHLAVQNDQSSIVQMLLSLPNIRVDSLNNNNESPLTLSIKSGNRRLLKMIFSAINKPIQNIEAQALQVYKDKPLGSGGFSTEYEGKFNNEIVAVKTIRDMSSDILEREIDTMQQCRSPYVLNLVGMADLDTHEPKLVLEYMDGGDLRTYLDKKRNNVPTTTNYSTLEIAWVIANGLADIHHNGCIHRDLKSHNVLLSTKHYIKLADLGLTRDVDTSMTRGAGTPYWTAPEVFTGGHYGYAADIYSFGVVLTELDTLEMPYARVRLNPFSFMNGVCNGSLRPSVSSSCLVWYKTLVEQCLAHDPSQRPSAMDIVGILRGQLLGRGSNVSLKGAEAQGNSSVQSEKQNKFSRTSTNTTATLQTSNASLKSLSSCSKYHSASALGPIDICCTKCKEINSILNESCTKCNAPMFPDAVKIKVLLSRLNKAGITPSCYCSACGEVNDIQATICEVCTSEKSDATKVIDLAMLLEHAPAP